MSTHFDVDQVEKQIRQLAVSQSLPPNAPPHTHIKLRHVDLQVEMAKFLIIEMNAGQDMRHILAALSNTVTEWLSNASKFVKVDQEEFFATWMNMQASMLEKTLDGDVHHGGSTTVIGVEGGRA